MDDDTQTMTVELTTREARALARAAALIGDVCAAEPRFQDGAVLPLDSGIMKLELALLMAGAAA